MSEKPVVSDKCLICGTSPEELEELRKRGTAILLKGEEVRRAQEVEDARISAVERGVNWWMHQAGWHRAYMKHNRTPTTSEIKTQVEELNQERLRQMTAKH